jgi:hypothetical protein
MTMMMKLWCYYYYLLFIITYCYIGLYLYMIGKQHITQKSRTPKKCAWRRLFWMRSFSICMRLVKWTGTSLDLLIASDISMHLDPTNILQEWWRDMPYYHIKLHRQHIKSYKMIYISEHIPVKTLKLWW